MMFTPPRFVAIDDKPHHLDAILEAFQQLGSPCMGIHFRPEATLEPVHFRGVRALFLDLHLIEGTSGTDNRRHYAQIASILEENISPSGGPFLLVVWTEHAQLSAELNDYLDGNLDADRPWSRPLAVLSLAKETFINVDTGAARSADALREAVNSAVSANPQLTALLNWEADALSAAGATLATLLRLVPAAERTSAGFSPALDVILSRLAREAVGPANVGADPRAAIGVALGPILADRIQNQVPGPGVAALWTAAVTRHGDRALPSATPSEAGAINRMLHLALPTSETIRPNDWGAVLNFPPELWNDQEIRRLFGVTCGELLGDEFKLGRDARSKSRPCLVRVGANCDHAQGRRGPLTYLFAMEVPLGVPRKADQSGKVRPPASEWSSPLLVQDEFDEPFWLHVNCRFPITVPGVACEAWQVRYRLREQLCMHLITFASSYISRPAIVQLPV